MQPLPRMGALCTQIADKGKVVGGSEITSCVAQQAPGPSAAQGEDVAIAVPCPLQNGGTAAPLLLST